MERHAREVTALLQKSPYPSLVSGRQYRDWRCLAEHVDLHEVDLQAINCERRLRIIFHEWAKQETVTVAKVHRVLTESQCMRAAECLMLAAQCMVGQQDEVLLDLGDQNSQLC